MTATVAGIVVAHGLLGLLAAGPLLACARCGGRATALASVSALALCAISAAAVNAAGVKAAGMVIVAGVVAVFVSVIRGRREGALIRINDRVQRAILRPLPAEFGGVAFASHYQSATKQALVGGDLYDVAMTQYGPRLIIGDVKGKGLDAVGRCAAVLAVFRELAVAEPDRKGRFFELGQQPVTEALAEPDLDAAIRQLVRLLLKHAGGRLADDILLVLSEPVGARDVLSSRL